MILNKPEPFQPTDTTDQMIRLEVSMNGTWLDRIEFECSQCHEHYWREIVGEEHFTEVLYYDGLGPYALNPTISFTYGPLLHNHQ